MSGPGAAPSADALPVCPVVHPALLVRTVPGQGAVLFDGERELAIPGEASERLHPLLDGRRTTGEIVEALAGSVPAETVLYALGRLTSNGHVVDAETWEDRSGTAPYPDAAVGVDPPVAVLRPIGQVPIEDALPPGFESATSPSRLGSTDLVVVVTDDLLDEELVEVNRIALSASQPWLIVRPTGLQPWLGPLLVPGRTACWDCLAHRLAGLRPARRLASVACASRRLRRDFLRVRTAALLSAAAEQIALWRSTGRARCLGAVVAAGPDGGAARRHPVDRRPWCSSCGAPPPRSWPVAAWSGGASSRAPAAQPRAASRFTFARLSPIGGISDRPRKTLGDGPGDPVHVWSATLSTRWTPAPLAELTGRHAAVCLGTGRSDGVARRKLAGEVAERWSGFVQGDEPRIRGSLARLGPEAVDPRPCMLFSETQYAERARWNALPWRTARVPEPLDPDAELDWTPVRSLTLGQDRLLPTALLFHGSERPDSLPPACSTGCAAGSTAEHALLGALLELVERDAVAVWWYDRRPRPAVALADWPDSWPLRAGRSLADAARDLRVLDVTTDVPVPTYVALSRRVGGERAHLRMGFGCHPDPLQALARSVEELLQVTASLARLEGEGGAPTAPIDAWLRLVEGGTQPQLETSGPAPERCRDVHLEDGGDYGEALEVVRDRIEGGGLEILAIEQTRPEIGTRVIRAVVPGLRPWRPRFAPGRLFSVPVALGLTARPRPESELNPLPFAG